MRSLAPWLLVTVAAFIGCGNDADTPATIIQIAGGGAGAPAAGAGGEGDAGSATAGKAGGGGVAGKAGGAGAGDAGKGGAGTAGSSSGGPNGGQSGQSGQAGGEAGGEAGSEQAGGASAGTSAGSDGEGGEAGMSGGSGQAGSAGSSSGSSGQSGAGGSTGTAGQGGAATGGAAGTSGGSGQGGQPATSVCDGVATASFQPPTVCDKVSGNTTSQIPSNGVFSTSWFGCYKKSDGTIYKDPGDNCEFACGNKGLCASGLSGPECEAQLKWFAADADRYGCGGRIQVTNCANGKSVILTTLDKGPNCKSVEQKYKAPVLDMSHDAMVYLFDGKTYGGSDLKRVVVEQVNATAKLGPVTP